MDTPLQPQLQPQLFTIAWQRQACRRKKQPKQTQKFRFSVSGSLVLLVAIIFGQTSLFKGHYQ